MPLGGSSEEVWGVNHVLSFVSLYDDGEYDLHSATGAEGAKARIAVTPPEGMLATASMRQTRWRQHAFAQPCKERFEGRHPPPGGCPDPRDH